MADNEKVLITKSKLTNIGDAIRSKTETIDTMTLDTMAQKISDIKIGGEQPQLNQPSISYTNGNKYFSVTNPSSNGNFAQGLYVYLNGKLVDTTTNIPTSYSLTIEKDVVYEYYVEIYGENMKASPHSNVIDICELSITANLDDNITSSNTTTTAYYGDSYETTFTVADGYYLGSHIEVYENDELEEEFEYDPNTGVFKIDNLKGKLVYTLKSSTKPFLQAPTLTRNGFTATWSSVENATSYEFHIFDHHTDHIFYTGTNLTCDFTSYFDNRDESGVYYIYVIAKGDGYQDSSERDKLHFYYNPNLELDSVFENNSWGDIAQGFSLGLASSIGWKLGDSKDLLIGDVKYPVRIVDMTEGRYKTSDGTKNHCVLMFSELYNTSYAMNSSQKTYDGVTNYTAGGWLNSDMRLNNIQKIYSTIGDNEFKTSVLKVLVGSAKYGGSGVSDTSNGGVVIYSEDKIFLPTQSEIFGSSAAYEYNSIKNLYPQFTLYKNNNTTTFRQMHKQNSTSNNWWWNRSPYCNGSGGFCTVDSIGDADPNVANYSGGVVACFAM